MTNNHNLTVCAGVVLSLLSSNTLPCIKTQQWGYSLTHLMSRSYPSGYDKKLQKCWCVRKKNVTEKFQAKTESMASMPLNRSVCALS